MQSAGGASPLDLTLKDTPGGRPPNLSSCGEDLSLILFIFIHETRRPLTFSYGLAKRTRRNL